jgi:hypothetical protein
VGRDDTHNRHQQAWTLLYSGGRSECPVPGHGLCWALWPSFAGRGPGVRVPLAPPGETSESNHRQDPCVPLALGRGHHHVPLCLGEARPAQTGPHLQNVEIKAPRTGRGSHRRESGFPAIGAQSAASRSSRIGDKPSGMSTRRMARCQLSCWKCHVRSRLWRMGAEGSP